ncbi:MAG: (Fe-S)-binding protein [Phycisphaerae bacterium]|nr:(Fe-S)-binding protein [Phycisphaerae bacterium]
MRVSLFIACLNDAFFPRVGIAAVRVLERLGCRVHFPEAQTCCGQPMLNNGHEGDARDLARRFLRAFAGPDPVVTPSGSCAAMIREHFAHLFPVGSTDHHAATGLAARTHEFSEFLTRVRPVDLRALGARMRRRVTYHYSCHLRGLGVTDEALRLLGQIEGVEVLPLEKAEQCCGFGGAFASKYPEISGAMVRDKVACIRATGARDVVSSEPGCTMNIQGACRREGCRAGFLSLPELIAESLGLLDDIPA